MSPRMQFRGPARQRGAIGLMAAGTLALALGFTLLVIDTGRLYMEQRKLQRVADVAALEAVSRGGNCVAGMSAAAFATQSAARNGFVVNGDRTLVTECGSLLTGADNLRAFTVDAGKSSAVRVIASNTVDASVAVGIWNLFSGAPVSLGKQLKATAVAALPSPALAQLSIRSTVANVSLLNPLFSALLGSSVNLTLASWNGLLSAHLNLLEYLNQLAIDLGVTAGNYEQLLTADVTIGELIKAAAKVALRNGATAEVITGLNALASAAISPTTVHLGDFLKLQTGGGASGLNADMNVFQLIQGLVQFGSSQNALAVNLPVNLLGLGVGATARIKVVEPPQFSVIGNPTLAKLDPLGVNKIYVRTAQVRILVTVDLSLATTLVGVVTDLLSVVTGLLGLDLRVLPNPNLDISLEAGGGNSYVTDYTCISDTNKSLTARTTTELARLRVGRVNSDWESSTSALTVAPLPLLDIGHKSCPSCARTAYAGGGADIRIDSPALQSSANYTFINPPKVGLPGSEPPYTLTASNAVAGMSQAVSGIQLIVHAPTFNPGVLLGLVFNTLLGLVNQVLALLVTTLSNILSPLLDSLLNNVLLTLGIEVGKIQVSGNLSCGQPGKAYLVI
ncbi:pilus assembly protein TadG-related protein [Pseudomonas fluorescens]|uniref:Putative Flp pilus-assembly TadG-like N-terminal domain-containing protein n=1 Tax=Pseudomonas fluorescens TaxID=294 RepID=A0A5E7NXZ0_PSEFL|nr:pilus assembly protein TadG-related protein [Pseudomonas fluorescens]VVP41849.1 hypothetical protein PS854_04864 [Pseudomonas fluorescens]